MTQRDFRCLVSGVSLLNAEAALVLLGRYGGTWQPISLPLWGIYDGLGSLGEMQDGPNSALILSGFQAGLSRGTVAIDSSLLGQNAEVPDHIETLANLLACSQVPELDAIRWEGEVVGFSLLSAHVAAALMGRESALPVSLAIDELPRVVLPSPISRGIYEPMEHGSLRLRCQFGLSFVGFSALNQAMRELGVAWSPAGAGIELSASRPELWLSEAMLMFEQHDDLMEAFGEHLGSEPVEDADLIQE